ncbi:MAG: RICIN domain-containing protein [Mucilaginibacter sp.]|nr:RICIN domain-containing protein [Mucilaginibacter sp.]
MKTLATIVIAMVLFTGIAGAQTIKGTYAIKNVETGMLLRIKDANTKNGTPIVLYEPQNWKCMTWDFKHVDGNTYQLQNLFSGKTLQALSASTGSVFDEQPIKQSEASQLYDFEPAGKNVFLIKLKGTDQYITSTGESEQINSLVKLAPKSGSKSQQWTIYQQSPTM